MKASTFLAFIGGAALGALIALLLAPEDGVKTRKKIKRKLKEYGIRLSKEDLNEFIEHFKRKHTQEPVEDNG